MVKMKSTKISRFGVSERIKFQTLFNHGGDEDGENNFTKMMARKIFLLGYTGADWRMQKFFKMMFGVDHTCIPS